MSRVRIEPLDPAVVRGEFDRFHRASPFEHVATAEPLPRTTHIGESVTAIEVYTVHTRVSTVKTRVVVRTTQ